MPPSRPSRARSRSHSETTDLLAQGFKCPKCRGEQAHATVTALPPSELSRILFRPPGKYALVSCELCGYTEMYDLAAWARNSLHEPAAQGTELPAASRTDA